MQDCVPCEVSGAYNEITQMNKEEKKSVSADSAPKHLRNRDLALELTFLDEHLFKKDFVSSHSKTTICLLYIYIYH